MTARIKNNCFARNVVDCGMPKKATKQILIADDDNLMFHILRSCLQTLAADITYVRSGLEAVEFVSNNHVDVIIMDYSMPGLTGIESARQIRQLENGSAVQIVMLTGTDQTDVRKEASELAIEDFMTKPFSPRHLLQRTKEMLADA